MKKLYALGFSLLAAMSLGAQNLSWPAANTKLVGDATESLSPVGPAGSWRANITPDLQYQHGGVWRGTAVDLTQNFKLTVLMNFGTRNEAASAEPANPATGADGIAFVLHNYAPIGKTDPAAAGTPGGAGYPLGGYGSKIGYATGQFNEVDAINYTFPNQFAVEFDTWWNGVPNGVGQENDPAYTDGRQDGEYFGPNHVAFMKNGNANHNQGPWAVGQLLPFILEDGLDKKVTFEYTYALGNQTLKVTVENPSTSQSAVFTYTGDILATIGAGPYYLGFTSATGQARNLHQVEILADAPNCGQLRTQTQGGWGQGCNNANGGNPGCYRDANFNTAFPMGVTIGDPAGRALKFNTSAAVEAFLPSGGPNRTLQQLGLGAGTTTYNTSSGDLGRSNINGQLLALSISVGFDDAIANFAPSAVELKDMIINAGPYAGMTVGAFLAYANKVIGGTVPSSAAIISNIHATATAINENNVDGTMDNGYLKCPVTTARVIDATSGRNPVALPVLETTAASNETLELSSVFPNPSRGQVQVKLAAGNASRNVEVMVVDARGTVVERRVGAASQVLNFNLRKYGVGTYMVKIYNGSKVQTEKVFVQD